MTIPYRIQVETTNRAQVEKIIHETFNHVNETFNHFNPDSELSRFNHLPAGLPCQLSPDLASLFYLAKNISTLSAGRYDPTAMALINAWKEALKRGAALTDASDIPFGFHHLTLEGNVATKKISGLSVDLDSIAKGYAIDLIARNLERVGYSNFLIEWGGEVYAHGAHPDRRPWKILIEGQTKPIDLNNFALATSGNRTFQYATSEGLYTHFIDLKSKSAHKIKSLTQATVGAPTCALADALATCLLLFECDEDRNFFIKEVEKTYPAVVFYSYEENGIF